MSYSGVEKSSTARTSLGAALEALQADTNIPGDVMEVASNIAGAVGALFEAEHASSEVDGKSCVKRAIAILSQTLALLQDVRAENQGIELATKTIAEAMSTLYPLSTAQTRFPPAHDAQPDAEKFAYAKTQFQTASQMPKPVANTPSIQPDKAASVPPVSHAPQSPSHTPHPASASPSAQPAVSGAPATENRAVSVPISAERQELEANIGANTETNLFVGFSGEISEGGVFVATYNVLAKGTPVHLLLTLPGGFEMNLFGVVRFVRDPMDFSSDSEPGIGGAFESLSQEHRQLLLRFIQKRPPIFYDE
ncbi:MAG: PilZ domain-containing protein [Myxococcales bacterium]|nr:MAG: PilZ domain-containing protein [Myxococcales bacterium]